MPKQTIEIDVPEGFEFESLEMELNNDYLGTVRFKKKELEWEWLTRNNNKTQLSINSYDPSSPNGYD